MALQKLNTLGLTETRVGEGTFVQNFHMRNYFEELFRNNIISATPQQINEFRILLEMDVMRLVFQHGYNEEQLSQLRDIQKRMEHTLLKDEISSYHKYHYSFHFYICKMSNNPLFIYLYDALHSVMFGVFKQNSESTWNRMGKGESIRHHDLLVKALEQHDLGLCMAQQDDLFNIY